jgi:hypothetical protein
MNINHLYKYICTTIFSISVLTINAQDLAYKIPSDAKAVITLKAKNMTELMSVKEFSNTFLGKEIIKKIPKSTNGDSSTLEDLGFNLSSNFYYYNLSNDSVSYDCVLAPVKNAGLLDELFRKSEKEFTLNDKLRSFYNHDSTEVVLWNDALLLFAKSDGKDNYFSRPEVSKRLGLPLADSTVTTIDPAYDQAADAAIVDTTTVDYGGIAAINAANASATVATENSIEKPGQVIRNKKHARHYQTRHPKNRHKKQKKTRKYAKKPIISDEEPPAIEEPGQIIINEAYDTAYAEANAADSHIGEVDTASVNASNRIKKIKNDIVLNWTRKMTTDFFIKDDNSSILNNKDFVKSIDEKAEITAWIPSTENALMSFMPTTIFKGINFLNGTLSGKRCNPYWFINYVKQ